MIIRNHKNIYPFFRKKNVVLFFIIFFGAILRISLLCSDQTISRDAAKYLIYAACDMKEGVSPSFPPLFLWMIRLIHFFGFSWNMSGWILSLISGIMLIPVVWMIAIRLTKNETVGIIAALLTAIHPTLSFLSIEILRDSFFLLIEWIGFYYLLGIILFDRTYEWMMFGLFSALAFLTRFEGIELLLLLLLAPFFMYPRAFFNHLVGRFLVVAITWLIIFLLASIPNGVDFIKDIYFKRALFSLHVIQS